ncbi:hypothetical protein OR1_03395 [Geobacter sp. OR-1]|uniref:glycosyltransferase family 2 protein n=1 Tax=Geobacter sp. OR-1 TaxID=1266765 RepID=UPI000542648F|nr:glycosyltransferase family 2 protein [Geobacter sp. OR-1]GAM11086.1 hypothetical protein OR1_03395 [Geobacter sp. OR-1]
MPADRRLGAYLSGRAIAAPWSIAGHTAAGFHGAVVIPSLAENANLPATLASLAQNPADDLKLFLILVVVNHRTDAASADKADNLATLEMLEQLATTTVLNLAWVDAASPGLELPVKGGGVGMARKIGFDLVLPRLSWNVHSGGPLLVALDADTLVGPDYLPAITRHFRSSACGGAVIPFRHQEAATATGQDIIDRYELFLRSYVLGLNLAGSPYAFHTVGSAMACTGTAYLRSGGMNTRTAGEDFYFLQQLRKIAGVEQLSGTMVLPSPRPSHRVPFGTGRSVSKALAGAETAIQFYHPGSFALLGSFLSLASASCGASGDEVMRQAVLVSHLLAEYLEGERFVASWDRIAQVKKTSEAFLSSFHEWFDALRTMKLMHHLAAVSFPRCSAEEAVPPLLEAARLRPVPGVRGQLELLRTVQNRVDPPDIFR